MPRIVSYLVVTTFGLAIFFFTVVLPGIFNEALNPDNYYRFYGPLIGLGFPACAYYLLDYIWLASLSRRPSLVDGPTMYVLALFLALAVAVCAALFALYTSIDAGAVVPSKKGAYLIASSGSAFGATIFLMSSILAACGAYNVLLHKRGAP